MSKQKLNNLLSFKDFATLGKSSNQPGNKIVEKVNYGVDGYEYTNEEWDFANKIGKKMGLVGLSPDEMKAKCEKLLANGGEEKLFSYIQKSSNPDQHMKNYEKLKTKGGLSFCSFVVFLFKKKSDLVSGTPLYYKISNFDVTDTTIRTQQGKS